MEDTPMDAHRADQPDLQKDPAHEPEMHAPPDEPAAPSAPEAAPPPPPVPSAPQEPEAAAPPPTAAPSHTDQLNVHLSFEVGCKEVAVGALNQLRPGYTFELETPVDDKMVTIRANSTVIGRGELVQIGDRVGVRWIED